MAVGEQPIIIKKIKKVSGGGHHGGAWKVAYADFVTAMMAFFLLMWLINTTSPEQKRGIADYFAPASVSQTMSGAGGILGGSALGADGSKSAGSSDVIEELAPPPATNDGDSKDGSKGKTPEEAAAAAMAQAEAKREEAAFESAAQSLRQALQSMPEARGTVEEHHHRRDPRGPEDPASWTRKAARCSTRAPPSPTTAPSAAAGDFEDHQPAAQRISIYGHTSASLAAPARRRLGALSARADESRKVLQGAGVDADRVYQVSGKAGSEPLCPDDPMLPGNRRIAIVLLREAPVLPADPGL